MAEGQVLEETRAGAVAILTMRATERRNALSNALRVALADHIEALAADAAVRAVVLTGAGGHFCAGGDLSDMHATDMAAARERLDRLQRLARLLLGMRQPVVAAVEGWAAGAGLSLMLCCDIVVAAADAQFAASFVRVGLAADLGLLHTLPARVGEGRARQMLLTGGAVDAATAERIGLVNEVVPAGTAMTAALASAQRLAAQAPLAIAAMKAQMAGGLEAVLAWEREVQPRLLLTADHAEGKAAFFAKRAPAFSGR
jgi:enoyl-CoA hydratase/carnithine racemase